MPGEFVSVNARRIAKLCLMWFSIPISIDVRIRLCTYSTRLPGLLVGSGEPPEAEPPPHTQKDILMMPRRLPVTYAVTKVYLALPPESALSYDPPPPDNPSQTSPDNPPFLLLAAQLVVSELLHFYRL